MLYLFHHTTLMKMYLSSFCYPFEYVAQITETIFETSEVLLTCTKLWRESISLNWITLATPRRQIKTKKKLGRIDYVNFLTKTWEEMCG